MINNIGHIESQLYQNIIICQNIRPDPVKKNGCLEQITSNSHRGEGGGQEEESKEMRYKGRKNKQTKNSLASAFSP